jgi:lantibiotic modifying enzyme
MRSSSEPSPAGGSRRGLLVLGYQGTLQPDPQHTKELAQPAQVAEHLLGSRLTAAQRDLKLRLSAGQHDCRGDCIDYGSLVEALRERLTGILIQVLALDPDANEERLARQYLALPALLKAAAAEWVGAVATFHRRFHRDAGRLAAWLGDSVLPELESLTAARSDAHAGGHKVLRLLFRNGHSVYYKPRPVTGEWLWDGLVHAVNAHSALRLPSAAALAGSNGRYGWVASIEPHTGLSDWDKSSAQAAAYWRSAGATLCLAAHVRMTDLHLANILATCDGPAPVDAESLATPPILAESPTAGDSEPAIAGVLDNLLATGLLPIPQAGDLPDVSGLFGRAAAVPGILVPHWSAASDGSRRLQRVPSALLDHGNAPPGVSSLEALPLLVSGYREAADALIRCRESLLAPVSPWRWTLERLHAPRIILRDTLTYGLLLSESLAPELLQTLQRRRIALRKALRRRDHGTTPDAVVRAETRNLLELHIPRFTALPASRELAGGSGRALAKRFFACSPAEGVLRAIAELSGESVREIHIPGLMLAILGQRAQP